jgi:hypothetical protein
MTMKTILSKLSNEKAQEEVKQFSIAALVCGALSLLIFWWLGFVAVGFGARSLLLTRHSGNKDSPKRAQYRIMSLVAIATGLISIVTVL